MTTTNSRPNCTECGQAFTPRNPSIFGLSAATVCFDCRSNWGSGPQRDVQGCDITFHRAVPDEYESFSDADSGL